MQVLDLALDHLWSSEFRTSIWLREADSQLIQIGRCSFLSFSALRSICLRPPHPQNQKPLLLFFVSLCETCSRESHEIGFWGRKGCSSSGIIFLNAHPSDCWCHGVKSLCLLSTEKKGSSSDVMDGLSCSPGSSPQWATRKPQMIPTLWSFNAPIKPDEVGTLEKRLVIFQDSQA